MPSAVVAGELVATELAGTLVASVASETAGAVVAAKETAEGALDFVVAAVVVVGRKASFHWYCPHWTILTSIEFRDLSWLNDCFAF